MNWNQIQYIIVTAEEKNMTRAAKKLYISQPSLSISIKQLETELGKELFVRQNGQLELTYAGQLFYEWAKTVAASQRRLTERFAELCGGERELIRIGISPHRSTVVTPKLLNAIYERYPACEIHLVEKPTNELEILLDEDELDMIIDVPGSNSVTYHYEEITEEGMCLAVPESFLLQEPFSKLKEEEKEIALEKLGEYGFIMLPGQSYFGQVSRKNLEMAGIAPKVICECTLSETVRNLVEKQMGIALLPDSFLSVALVSPHIRYYRLKGNQFRRKIGVVYKNERYHSEIFLKVVDLVKQIFLEIYTGSSHAV